MAIDDATVDPATVQIFKPPVMVNPSVYPMPIPFGGMGDPATQKRILRPLPIPIRVTEAPTPGGVKMNQAPVGLAHPEPHQTRCGPQLSDFDRLRSCPACKTTARNARQAALALR
jgi:hypothetical protein